jgi:hypothetical protein
MSVKTRLEKLEKRLGTDDGQIYVVYKRDDIYTLQINDGDNIEMTKDEFEVWQGSKSENDFVITVKYQDVN